MLSAAKAELPLVLHALVTDENIRLTVVPEPHAGKDCQVLSASGFCPFRGLVALAQRVPQHTGKRPFERCLSFHSLSKRSNLPGLRSGFAAGDSELIRQYLSYRTYHGCAMSAHHQHASALAWRDESHVIENRQMYRDKFSAVSDILAPHYDLRQPQGGFYHWLRTPIDDLSFSQHLLQEQHVTVMPGTFLGRGTTTNTVPGGNPGQGQALAMDLRAEVGLRFLAFREPKQR